MKLGRNRFGVRRSSPLGTDPVRQNIMSDYAQSVQQFGPQIQVDTNENNLLTDQIDQQEASLVVEEPTVLGKSIQLMMDEAGMESNWLHPEDFKNAGTTINELLELQTFLPDKLARQSAAKSKARKQAEDVLPANASVAQVEDLADKIYKSDLTEALTSEITGTPLSSDNVLQQVRQDEEDMQAYRIMTDPYQRAAALGWYDRDGEFHDGMLSIISKQVEEELKERASNFGEGYFDSMFLMLRDLGAMDNTDKAMMDMFGRDNLGEGYVRDAQNGFLQGRKDVRIQNYQGQIERGTEFKNMADNVLRVYQIKDELDEVNAILDQYKQAYAEGGLNERQREAHADMLSRKHQLEDELSQISRYVDILGSYESMDVAKDNQIGLIKDGKLHQPTIFGIPIDPSRPRDFTQAIQGKLNKYGVSTDIGVHHYLAGYDKLVRAINQLEQEGYRDDPKKMERMRYLRGQLTQLLNNYKGLIDERIQDWSKSAKEESDELDEMKRNYTLSDAFLANVELAQRTMDFADANTMMFAMPQQLGSSNASMLLSMGSMATKIIAAMSGNPAVLAGGIVAGSQMGISNAAWENNAEVAEGYKRKVTRDFKKAGIYDDVINEIKHRIPSTVGQKDDDVLRRLFNGEVELNNIKANQILTDAVYGADLAFQYDMGETARGEYRESMIQLMPLGPIAKAGKWVLSPAGRAVGWTVNKTAEGISNAIHKGVNATRKAFKKDPLVVAEGLSKFNKVLDNTIHFATSIPRGILLGETYASNLIGFGGRTWLNAIGEGIEESVQHVTQARFYNGEYDTSMNMGLFKPIVEDMVLGGRLGLEWLTGNDYGSGYASDAQMFAEMRGGAIGALFQATPINVVSSINNASSEIAAAEFVANNLVRDKMSQRDKIEKIKSFLLQTSSARYDDVMKKFDRFIKINNTRTEAAKRLGNEEYGIAEEFIEETRDLYKRAHNQTVNDALNSAYKAAGYYKNTPEYNERIAILVDQIDRLKESSDAFAESEQDVQNRTIFALTQDQTAELSNETEAEQQPTNHVKMELVARLKAALDIIHQYDELERTREAEGKPARKSAIKQNAQTVKKLINKLLGTNINTVEELFEQFGAVDDLAVETYRNNIVLQTERDVARATVSRLLTPLSAVKTIDKLVKQYNEAIKEDEELQQRIQDDYVAKVEMDEEIRQMQEQLRNQPVDTSGEENLEEEEETDNTSVTTSYELEDEDNTKLPVTLEQADALIDGFINRFSPENPEHPTRGSIKKNAINIIRSNMRAKINKLKRSNAQRLASLFNEGYRARTIGDKFYFIKGNDRIKISRTEALFGQYLEEQYGSKSIERDESFRYDPGDQSIRETPAAPSTPSAPEPEEEKQGYTPNAVQEQIRQTLKDKAEEDKKTLVKRNSHNYFFRIAEKLIMYTRLHAEIGAQKPDSEEDNKRRQQVIDDLTSMWAHKDKLKAYVTKLQQDFNTALDKKFGIASETYAHNAIDLSLYLDDQLIDNQNIIEAIADITKGLRYNDKGEVTDVNVIDGPWAKAGNIFDTLFRMVLDGRTPSYADIMMIEDAPVIISDVMSASVFDNTVNQMLDFKKWLDDNEIVPVTDRVLLHTQLQNGHNVAGETDLIGIDRNGNLIIFDFKTSQWEFDSSYRETREGNNWSTERQHSRQLTGYNVLIEQEFSSKYPVTRMMIVPAVVQYDVSNGIFTRFNSIGIRPLIELQIDSPLNKALHEQASKQDRIDDNTAELTSLTESIEEYSHTLIGKFEHLSEGTLNRLKEIRTRLNEIGQHLNELDDDSTDLEIANVGEDIYNLLQDFRKLTEEVDEEIQMLIEAGVQFDKHQERQDEHEDREDEADGEPRRQREGESLEEFQQRTGIPADDDGYWEHLAAAARGEDEPQRKRNRVSDHTIDELRESGRLDGPDRGRISGTLPDDEPSPEGTTAGAWGAAPVQAETKSINEAPDYSKQKPVEFTPTIKETGRGHEAYNAADQRDIKDELAEDAGEDDFTKQAIFKVKMDVVDKGLNGRYLQATITWKGKDYAVAFEWAKFGDGVVTAQRIKEKIQALMAAHPGAQIIISKLSRTNGRFRFEGDLKRLLDSVLMTDDDELLDILDSGHLGVTNTAIVPQVNTLSRTSNGAIHTYSVGAEITPGIVTWVMRPQRAEYAPGEAPTIAIPLTHRRLQEGDIDLIIDILKKAKGRDLTREFRKITVNGKQVTSPMSDWAILNTLIRFGRAGRETNKGYNFVFDFVRDGDQVDKTMIEISGVGSDRNNIYHVDLTKPEEVEKLKQRLRVSGFVYANNEQNMLKHNLDSSVDTSPSNPFGKVSAFFKAEENKGINSIQISPSLIFDRKDVDFREDGSFIALSGAGWMVRHGWVTTNFQKLVNPRISMEDVDIEDADKNAINEQANAPENNTKEAATAPVETPNGTTEAAEAANQTLTSELLAQQLAEQTFMPFRIQREPANTPIDEALAIKRIHRMLGKHFKVNVIDGAIKVFEQGKAWAVGVCKRDSITLSRLAEAGTEFHEAFHRVMELLFSPSARRKLHDHYIKRYNNGEDMTEQQTGERLAEMFMLFINGLPHIYLSWNVKKMFDQVIDWVNAWRNLDDYTLALTFAYAYSGLARFNKVSKASSDNFDRIFKGVAYSTIQVGTEDINFKHFVNSVHLRDGIKFATYLILTGYNIDSLGKNLKDLDIRMLTMREKRWFKIATAEGMDNPPLIALQMREIFDHWGSTQKLVVEQLERLSIVGKLTDQKKAEDKQGPDVSVIYQDIDGHIDEFYRFDKKDDLDISLRIFLSTILNLRYSTRADLMWETNEAGQFIDKNGNVTTDMSKRVRRTITTKDGKTIPVGTVDHLVEEIPGTDDGTGHPRRRRTMVAVSTNSIGSPEFMDFDTVYSQLINKLLGCVDVQDMIDTLIKLSAESPMYRQIAYKMYEWNAKSVARHPSNNPAVLGKPMAFIGDMRLAKDDYEYVKNEHGVYHIVYAKDAEGKHAGDIIENAYILTNPDMESLVTTMFQSFKSQRLKFIFVFADQKKDSQGNKTGKMTYRNKLTNSTASVRIYPKQWFDNLRNGVGDIFELEGSSIRAKKGHENTYVSVANTMRMIYQQMMNTSNKGIVKIKYNGKDMVLNKYLPEDLDLIETLFVGELNKIGIEIDKNMLDFYLNDRYPNLDNKTDRFIEMLSNRSKQASFQSFIKMLDQMQNIVSSKNWGQILTDMKPTVWNKYAKSGMYIYSENAFVKELAEAYGRYRLATNEFMTLGPENTKMYTMAQNHSGSDFTDDMNRAVVNKDGTVTGSEYLNDMMKFVYNYMRLPSGKNVGSVIIKHLLKPNRMALELGTFIGVRRDDIHDGGTKYTKISKRDDYLAKCTILENGGITFPTLSDKSTWFYLTGVRLPGIDYSGTGENTTVHGLLPKFNTINGRMFWGSDTVGNYGENEVLDQMLEYAECERAAVVKAINELKTLKEDEKSEKNPGRKLEIHKQIENYHTNNQAARFAFLLGVYTEDKKDGYKYKSSKEKFISFNFTKKWNKDTKQYEDASLEDCLKTADKYFFNKSKEERRSLIANILQHRLDEQLEWAVNAGIIEKVQNNIGEYASYKNKLLNDDKIQALKKAYSTMLSSDGKTRYGRIFTDQGLESLAVVAYLNDINAKSIMSIEEVMRLYTGIPQFFKWKYGDDGVLLDLHSDLVKRLGGTGSTGDSNRLDLPNIERDYTCAEIKDQNIKSEIYEAYREGFLDNEYRVTVFQQEVDKAYGKLQKMTEEQQEAERQRIWEEIMSKDLEDVKKMASRRTRSIVEANAAAETASFEAKINVADGTAFISPQMCLNLLRQRGVFTTEVLKAFEYLMDLGTGSDQLSNHKAYSTIFNALISTQKYSAFGYRMEGDIPVHFYNKFALFPLFKSMAYGFTQDLYNKMLEDGVDMLMFESAVKSGSEGKQEFNPDTFRRSNDENDENNWNHDTEGNRTEMKPDIRNFHFNTYKQQYKFIRRQLNTDPNEDDRMHIGTQMLKITLANLFKEAMYKTKHGEISGRQLRDDIMMCMKKLSDDGLRQLKEELFTDDKIDIKKLSAFLIHELSMRNADINTLEGLEVIGEGDNARFVTPLEAMANLEWIESILISHINKQVIDINLPGNAFYQRTAFGIEGAPIRIVSDEALDTVEDDNTLQRMLAKAKKQFMIYSGRSLKAINNKGSMDCIISMDYFMNQPGLIPKELRGNFWAARDYLKKKGVIGKNAEAIMIGYRIPTQAESSVHALRVVDVLPVVRDTIILPKDFTKTTGSDFDIDKLYLTSYNFNEDGSTEFEESDMRYWQNRLLNNYITLLQDGGYVDDEGKYHKGRTLQFLHRSIDNDTALAKGDPKKSVYNRIYGNLYKEPEQPFKFQSLSSQVDIKTQFLGGKFNIGPFALANNAQIMTMLYDVSFKNIDGSIMSVLGANSLHNRTDKNGNSILAWISAMINGAVDAAKDPWEAELNVNPYTYGIINMLLRTGMGDQTFMFINQPIMREAAEAFVLADGVMVEDAGKTKTRRQEEAVESRLHFYLDSLGDNYKKLIDIMTNPWKGEQSDKMQIHDKAVEIAQQLFGVDATGREYTNEFYTWDIAGNDKSEKPVTGRSILEDIIVNPEVRIDPDKPMSMDNMSDVPYYAIKINGEYEPFSAKEVQLYVMAAMYEFKPFINALEDTVKYTKIDTKKQGKSFATQKDYFEKYEALLNDENSLFDDNLKTMLRSSFIDDKTRKTWNFLNSTLGDMAVQYKDGFQDFIDFTKQQINNYSDEVRPKIQRMALGYIKLRFFKHYMDDHGIDEKKLFVGRDSISNRFSRIRRMLLTDQTGEYQDYVANGVIINTLLDALQTVPYDKTAEQPAFVMLKRAMIDDPDMANDITKSWRYMLNDNEHPELLEFARDLIVYAFLTSNDFSGFTHFFKFVPKEWKEQSGFNKWMTKFKEADDTNLYQNLVGVLDEMLEINWFDNSLVPVLTFSQYNSNTGSLFFGYHINTNNPVIKKSGIYSIMGAAWFDTNSKRWKVSIKDSTAPQYIKIYRRNADFYEDDKILLYKLVDHGTKIVGKNMMTYPIYALVVPPGASVNASGNRFNIYSNIKFDHPVASIAMDITDVGEELSREDKYHERVDDLIEWLQQTPGNVLEDNVELKQLKTITKSPQYDTLLKEATMNAFTEDDWFQEAVKKGEEIKDFCNGKR